MKSICNKKVLTFIIALFLIFTSLFMFTACGKGGGNNSNPPENPPAENNPTEEVVEGLNVVLSFEEAEALINQAQTSSIQLRNGKVSTLSSRLTIADITKEVAVIILNQVRQNMLNSSAVWGYTEYDYEMYDMLGKEEFVITLSGEQYQYTAQETLNNSIEITKTWYKLEEEVWNKYEINGIEGGEMSYTKTTNYMSPNIGTEGMKEFWYGMSIITTKVLTADDIVGISAKNNKIYINLSATIYEEKGEEEILPAWEQFTIKNGRIETDYPGWEGMGEMFVKYKYNNDVDLTLLTLPTLPEGVTWQLKTNN